MATIAALVPMRHESVRIAGKNYRPFAGLPLYHHIVMTLLTVPAIDLVVIDTDSDVIRTDAALHFPSVQLLDRPQHLRAGETPMNEVLLNTVEQVDADWYIQTHSTNPLLTANSIENAIARLLSSTGNDSLFTVTRLYTRLWSQHGKPLNHDPSVLVRTQDLDPILEENSNFFMFTGKSLRTHRNRIGSSPILFELPRAEAWDIDDELDFAIAECLYRRTGSR